MEGRHFSASVPIANVTTLRTMLRRALKATINFKEAENYVRKRPILLCVAQYNHFHAYDVRANCYNKVYVHKIIAEFPIWCGRVVERRAEHIVAGFCFSGGARSKLRASLFFLSNFFAFFLFYTCFFASVWFLYLLSVTSFLYSGFYFHYQSHAHWIGWRKKPRTKTDRLPREMMAPWLCLSLLDLFFLIFCSPC